MKPFLFSLPLFYIAFLIATFMTMSLPMPGNDPIPEWVIRETELKNRIFEIITFPGKPLGPDIGMFIAPLVWALLFAAIFQLLWRFTLSRFQTKAAAQ